MKPKIDDCPNCGRKQKYNGNNKPKYSEYEGKHLGNHYVRCGNCGLGGPFGKDKDDAIKLWGLINFPNKTNRGHNDT